MATVEDKGKLPRKEYFSTFTADFLAVLLPAVIVALALIAAGLFLHRSVQSFWGAALFVAGIAVLAVFIPVTFFLFGEKLVITAKALRLVSKNLEVTILFSRIAALDEPPARRRLFRTTAISDGESRITVSSLKYPEYDEIVNLIKIGQKQAGGHPGSTAPEKE